MLLFYAWTDIQIINSANVKYNYYLNEKADLVVWSLDRVSARLIDRVKEEKTFNHVYILELPVFYSEKKHQGIVEKLQMPFNGYRLKKYFEKKLASIVKEKYDILLIPAFWGESMNVYRYLRKKNSGIEIKLVDEGLSYYNGPKEWLYHTSPSLSFRAKLRGLLYYGFTPYLAKKATKATYLYRPDISEYSINLEGFKLPSLVKKKNESCYNLLRKWEIDCIEKYVDAKLYYIADAPRMDMKCVYSNLYDVFGMIHDVVDRSEIIIKAHPTSLSLGMPLSAERLGQAYIDYRREPFELLGLYIDFNNKIFIVNNTSTIFYLNVCFNMEPYVIFVYRLSDTISPDERLKYDKFTNEFQNMYRDKTKIAIPESQDELEEIMHLFLNRCYQ